MLILHSKYSVILSKNILLQTAFSAIFPTGIGHVKNYQQPTQIVNLTFIICYILGCFAARCNAQQTSKNWYRYPRYIFEKRKPMNYIVKNTHSWRLCGDDTSSPNYRLINNRTIFRQTGSQKRKRKPK